MINGILLRDAIISASNNITNNRHKVDELNVFPVPDGDTGTNMSMTISSASRELAVMPDSATLSEVISTASSALLRGARGNSGVILSLLFRGFSKGCKGKTAANGETLANALTLGVEAAYKAVMKPTEGTILTVSRVAAECGVNKLKETSDAVAVWQAIVDGANEALLKTPEQLPVLKKAGVVDAGGQGLVFILEGMLSVFKDGKIIGSSKGEPTPTHKATPENDIKFLYYTEFTVERSKKCEPETIKLRAYLEAIGEHVTVSESESEIKIRLNTNEPGNAIQKGLKYGPLINIKVENINQHKPTAENADCANPSAHICAKPEKKYGFVAVAAGDGVCDLFSELGVDNIVRGGQTMNPSTDDILNAVEATPAEHVFVLPNNKNIIMAAEQVIPLSAKDVSVLHTKTIPQGLTAMLNFDEAIDVKSNHIAMMKAANKVSTALVTFAARNSSFDGQNITKGEILGIENGKITLVEADPVKAAYKCTKHLYKKGVSSMVTIIFGNGITEGQASALRNLLSAKFGNDADIAVVNGSQPVYYFIISVE